MIDIVQLAKQTKDLTLLYVEDDKESRDNIVMLLGDMFKDIIIAHNGQDGLDKFKTNHIDLIITDINMPMMDGLEMSKIVKNLNTKIPIIIFTAIMDISKLKDAIDIGVDSFVNKPLKDIDLLFSKIDMVIKNINYNKIKEEEEKAKVIYNMLHNISHHWKQPLSVISIISSTLEYKIDNNISFTSKDFEQIHTITTKTQELSEILEKIDNIDFDTMDTKDYKEFVEISNKLYKKEQ